MINTQARDLKRASWTPYVFARDVKYSDLLRSFKGSDGYNRNRFVADCVQQPKVPNNHTCICQPYSSSPPPSTTYHQVSIINMRMLEGRGDAAEITWRLQGTINNIQFTATLVETITLNLVTGQITEHRSRWAIEQGGLAASLAYLLTRVSWSLRQGATDAGEAGNRALQSLTSIDEGDESQGTIMRNPNDPTKFFQQQDTFYQDAIGLLLFLAVMYTIFQGWNAVFQL